MDSAGITMVGLFREQVPMLLAVRTCSSFSKVKANGGKNAVHQPVDPTSAGGRKEFTIVAIVGMVQMRTTVMIVMWIGRVPRRPESFIGSPPARGSGGG